MSEKDSRQQLQYWSIIGHYKKVIRQYSYKIWLKGTLQRRTVLRHYNIHSCMAAAYSAVVLLELDVQRD